MITSAPRTASAALSAPRPPASTRALTLSGLRLWPVTSNPAFTRLAAIGPPMMPRPMKATVVMSVVLSGIRRRRSERGGALGAGEPVEGVGAGAAGLVLQTDPAVVARGRDAAQVAVDVEAAGAGLVAAGVVGDLDVPDPARRGRDRLLDVVAVDGQVVDVEQQRDVLRCAGILRGDPVDRVEGVGGGGQGVARGAADRLDERGAADPPRGAGGQGQVLRGQRVLLLRRDAVDAVAVQRVERPAAELPTQADGHVDVVAELRTARGPRHQAAVAAGHVACEEVEADELYTGVPHGRDERVHLGVGGNGDRPGPPELDRVEARLPGGGRPLQQGQLGEQDRQVDVEPHGTSFARWKTSSA